MKRTILVLLFTTAACLVAGQARAQQVGVKAGLMWSELRGDSGDPTLQYSRRKSWSAGGFARFGLGPASLQAEVLYSKRGAKITDTLAPTAESTARLDYIEIPVVVRLGSASTALYAGGYGALRVGAKVATQLDGADATAVDISDSVQELDYGLVFGIGLGFGKFGIDGRYVLGLRDVFKATELMPEPPSLKHGALAVFATLSF